MFKPQMKLGQPALSTPVFNMAAKPASAPPVEPFGLKSPWRVNPGNNPEYPNHHPFLSRVLNAPKGPFK